VFWFSFPAQETHLGNWEPTWMCRENEIGWYIYTQIVPCERRSAIIHNENQCLPPIPKGGISLVCLPFRSEQPIKWNQSGDSTRQMLIPLSFSAVTPCSLVLTFREKALPAPSECKSKFSIEKSNVNVGRLTAEAVVKVGETGEVHGFSNCVSRYPSV
jgi:hypothetical protein